MLREGFFVGPRINPNVGHGEGVAGEHMYDAVAVFVEGVRNPKRTTAVAFSRKKEGVARLANDGEKSVAVGDDAFFQGFIKDRYIWKFKSFFGDDYARELNKGFVVLLRPQKRATQNDTKKEEELFHTLNLRITWRIRMK